MDAERLRDKALTFTDLLAECEKSSLVRTAMSISLLVHGDQKREGGQPYMTHIEAVVHGVQRQLAKNSEPGRFLKLEDVELCLALGFLHDTVEDGKDKGFDGDYLSKSLSAAEPSRLPLVGKLVDLVMVLTRREGESYLNYILRVVKSPFAVFIKTCDLTHNLSDLAAGSRRDKYEMASHILTHRGVSSF